MKELIPKDEYGIFADTHDTARVDSRSVAAFFEKNHKEVLRDIRNLTNPDLAMSLDSAILRSPHVIHIIDLHSLIAVQVLFYSPKERRAE